MTRDLWPTQTDGSAWTPAAIDAYERQHGVKPPGFRGTGAPTWFGPRHPDMGPCGCGVETERWVLVKLRVGETVGHTPDDTPGQEHKGLLGEWVAVCPGCEDRASIASLERTLTRDGISERTRQQAEAALLALRKAKAA